MPVIWNAPSPTRMSGRSLGLANCAPIAGRNGETHGRIIGGPQKFGAVTNVKIGGAEEGIADIGHNDRIFGEKALSVGTSLRTVSFAELVFGLDDARRRPREVRRGGACAIGPEQPADEILESDLLVSVIADGSFSLVAEMERPGSSLAVNTPRLISVMKAPSMNDAIARLDVATNFFPAHGAFVNAQIKGMLLADDGFAQERGGDRDVGFCAQLRRTLLHSEAVHLDVRHDDRLESGVDHPAGSSTARAELRRLLAS